MLRSKLCVYTEVQALFKTNIAIPSTAFAGASLSNRNCAPCTDFTSEINNSEIDHAKNIDVSFNGMQ